MIINCCIATLAQVYFKETPVLGRHISFRPWKWSKVKKRLLLFHVVLRLPILFFLFVASSSVSDKKDLNRIAQ